MAGYWTIAQALNPTIESPVVKFINDNNAPVKLFDSISVLVLVAVVVIPLSMKL